MATGVLAGKNAIVTGSSSGIGRAIAMRFASEGACVALADIQEEPKEGGETTLKVIKAQGGKAFFHNTDVSLSEDIERLIATVIERCGRLDVIVNNAMTFAGTPLTETSLVEWNRVLSVNLTGTFLGCKYAVKQMLTQDIVSEARGRIVNITSQHGMIASPKDCSYGVSKAGGVYITRQIAADYAKDHIICNAVAPGKVLTGGPGSDTSEEGLAYSRSRTPTPRLGRPEDIANAAVYLASDQCSYMNGVNLLVDGGWMAA